MAPIRRDGMLMTHPLSSTRGLIPAGVPCPNWRYQFGWRANRVALGRLSLALTARARLAWVVRVWLSRAARRLE